MQVVQHAAVDAPEVEPAVPLPLRPPDRLPAHGAGNAQPARVAQPVETPQPALQHATAPGEQVGGDRASVDLADEEDGVAAGSELAVEGLDVVPREGGVPVLPGGERHELDQQTDVPRPAQPHTHAALRPLRRPVAQPPAEARAQLVLAACQVQPQGAGGRDPGLGRPEAADEQRATDVVPVVRGLHEERAAGPASRPGRPRSPRRGARAAGRGQRPAPRARTPERHADRTRRSSTWARRPARRLPHEAAAGAVPPTVARTRAQADELVHVGPRRPGDQRVPGGAARAPADRSDLDGDHGPAPDSSDPRRPTPACAPAACQDPYRALVTDGQPNRSEDAR